MYRATCSALIENAVTVGVVALPAPIYITRTVDAATVNIAIVVNAILVAVCGHEDDTKPDAAILVRRLALVPDRSA